MNSTLRLESVNGSPVVEYRAIDGHPVPFKVTIQRRALTPDGEEYIDGASDWQTITISDVLEQLKIDGPVAEWLRTQTRVNTSPVSILKSGHAQDAAYLWNVNA